MTLCLNEAEFIANSYAQHADFPGLVSWVFVEGADASYIQANPDMVSAAGLSTDGTSEQLRELAAKDPRVQYVPFGVMSHKNPAQAKCLGRTAYLRALDDIRPDLFVHVDADEFYTRNDQRRISQLSLAGPIRSWRFRQRHIWRPPSIADQPLFELEVIGGYWDVQHVRVFRWTEGLSYLRNHNWPEKRGWDPTARMMRERPTLPECIHLGFARTAATRAATNAYYRQRGEGVKDSRQPYVDCRAAWESWAPRQRLPHGALVVPFRGPIPEVFQGMTHADKDDTGATSYVAPSGG